MVKLPTATQPARYVPFGPPILPDCCSPSPLPQDEDENEVLPVTPQQMPPSTASIPPSVSVIPSGGVGHTASTHLPLPSLQAQGQSQTLAQLPPRPSPTTHQQQLVQSPQFSLASLQAPAATLNTVATNAAAAAGTRLPAVPNLYQTFQNTVPPGQQGATVLPPPMQPNMTATPQGLGYSTLGTAGGLGNSVGGIGNTMGGLSRTVVGLGSTAGGMPLQQPQTLLLLQQQQQQLQALQQQALIQRGLATLPARTDGSEVTPPPAKRHALEVPYRPGLPQHVHQLSMATAAATSAYPPRPPLTNFPQQLNSPQTGLSLGMLGGMTLPPPPPPVQLRTTMALPPTMPAAASSYTGRTAGSMHWQQQK